MSLTMQPLWLSAILWSFCRRFSQCLDLFRGVAVLTEILHQLDVVTEARRGRLAMAYGIVPGIIWIVLFSGAIVTVGFTFFFGTANLRAQALMTGALSLLIFSGLLIIIVIDHPLAGAVKVGPEALSVVAEDFGK
jgi:hypothetical protein